MAKFLIFLTLIFFSCVARAGKGDHSVFKKYQEKISVQPVVRLVSEQATLVFVAVQKEVSYIEVDQCIYHAIITPAVKNDVHRRNEKGSFNGAHNVTGHLPGGFFHNPTRNTSCRKRGQNFIILS